MSSDPERQWLSSTVSAVRELMLERLQQASLDADIERDLQMALEELDVMWDELKGQAELLQREQQRYAEFFQFSPDAYLITDARGKIREANRAAGELFAMAPQKPGSAGLCWLLRPT